MSTTQLDQLVFDGMPVVEQTLHVTGSVLIPAGTSYELGQEVTIELSGVIVKRSHKHVDDPDIGGSVEHQVTLRVGGG